jgi:hypothetical protein
MPGTSPFSQHWRDCLRAHYQYVVQQDDQRTERTLRGVLHEVGFGEDELIQLRVMATAHIDDVGADYIPDPALMAQIAALERAAAANQAAVNPGGMAGDGESVDPDMAAHDPHMAGRHEQGEDEAPADEPPLADPDVKQLSLF